MLFCDMVRPNRLLLATFSAMMIVLWAGGGSVCRAEKHVSVPVLRVAVNGGGDYSTVQAAIDHLPATGGVVLVAPGTYREQVIIHSSQVTIKGTGSDPSQTIIVDDTSQGTRGTKPSYATVHVLGDDFHATNITFENDFNRTHEQVSAGSQAQALNMEGDRNLIDHVRILANQDTLYVGAKGCGQSGSLRTPAPSSSSFPPTAQPVPVPAPRAPCIPTPTRSYFTHCVVAGNVDFIYGDGNVVFDDCEIHSTLHAAGGYLTAQGKHLADQPSTFVFNHCHLTAEPGEQHVFLGRPWRDYASVVYLHCVMDGHIEPAGWREWSPGTTHRLETAFYAEYESSGPGANVAVRDPHSHQLTAAQAKLYDTARFLAGSDHWNPEKEAKSAHL
jgi:pectin methylesterase-like acyl-CoA thioesterase